MARVIEAVMVGAGNRATFAYGAWALRHPTELRFTVVAEPHDERRRRFAAAHGIPAERQLASAAELHARGRLAEALFDCTGDAQHPATTIPALALGYDVLLEKPMATSLGKSAALARAAERSGAVLLVAHVLRYTPFFSRLHELLGAGAVGDVVSVLHCENVAYWHMAHSFVRGNWRRADEASPMILAKCCHDLDLLSWNLGPATRLGSFGSLRHFDAAHAPPGAPARCTDGCPAATSCPFDATHFYLGDHVGWPVNAVAEELSLAGRRRALETGPYGRCVYRCDNDVVDHQLVSLELVSGATAALVMHGHAAVEERTMRYDGTRATLRGRFCKSGGNSIELLHHDRAGRVERLAPDGGDDDHGGGDDGLLRAFVRAVRRAGGAPELVTSAGESLESHLLAFAAEEARQTGRIVELADLRRRALVSA